MKRGDKYLHGDYLVTILGPEDFDGYEYNRPSPQWELIRYPSGQQAWCGNIWLVKPTLIQRLKIWVNTKLLPPHQNS